MTHPVFTLSPAATARSAGLLYIAIAVFGAFAIGYMPTVVLAGADPAEVAANIAANEGLFRLGILADMGTIAAEVLVIGLLYQLLKPVNPTLSLIAALARMGMAVVMGLNLINYLVPILLVTGLTSLGALAAGDAQTLAKLFLEAHEFGVYVWQIFFGLHLVIMGYLVYRSGFLPRLLGAGMMLGSFGYSVQAIEKFVLPGNVPLGYLVVGLLTVVTIAEIAFALWLTFRAGHIGDKYAQTVAAA